MIKGSTKVGEIFLCGPETEGKLEVLDQFLGKAITGLGGGCKKMFVLEGKLFSLRFHNFYRGRQFRNDPTTSIWVNDETRHGGRETIRQKVPSFVASKVRYDTFRPAIEHSQLATHPKSIGSRRSKNRRERKFETLHSQISKIR